VILLKKLEFQVVRFSISLWWHIC